MRSQLFRTAPVLINGANVVVGTFDVDGAEPFTLFLENLDLAATLSTAGLFRSKDANLLFTAVTPGTGGNAITVQFSSSSLPAAQTTANGWVVNATAGTDLLPAAGTIAANSVAAREFTSGKAPSVAADVAMMRSMRIRVSKGTTNTSIVAAAIVK